VDGFQIARGAGFRSVTPIGGPYETPLPEHTYRFLVRSNGTPLTFRFTDHSSQDNYGALAISIGAESDPPPAPPDEVASASRPESTVFAELPSGRTCLSRRLFTIHVRAPRAVAFRTAAVALNGEIIKSRRTSKLVTAKVDLRRRTKGVYTLTGRIVTTRGQSLTTKRRYRTCTPKPAPKPKPR
jgi:hypothetical protein